VSRSQIAVNETRLVPFLKWAGGKRWFVANHGDLFPRAYGRYIEPFLGSAAVFFFLQPPKAILTDVNDELINAYTVIRDHWQPLGKALARHQALHNDEYYYAVRATPACSGIDGAARFIYLNRTCWNGLYRVNQRGEFNVPRGTKNSVLLDSDDFERLSSTLKSAKIKAADFEDSIEMAKRGDLLFVDPPYTTMHNHNGFIKYNDKIFSWDDQIRLRDAIVRADARGALIVMTNANHKSLREIYSGFNLRSLSRQSVLAGVANARGETEELLVTNLG